MRRISIVRNRGYGSSNPPIAFSQRRQAERYVESIVKKAWKQAIDLDAVGARYADRIRETIRAYGENHPYVETHRREMRGEMVRVRGLIDAGYRAFRTDYEYRYGPLPYIEDVQMYRTLAEYNNQ